MLIYEHLRRSINYNLPPNVEPAVHPIENGIMETPYGPVAAGTLLSGEATALQYCNITLFYSYALYRY